MNTINVNLTPKQLLIITDCLNREGQRFDQLRVDRRDAPRHSKRMWHDKAVQLFGYTRQLIAASDNNNHNPHIPIILSD